ncbi:MAG: formyltetrahydrofolate deformylase [Ignavibacteriaceae bacterium]
MIKSRSAILLIHCPDRTGLVASITEFIGKYNGNILYLDQHVDLQKKVFFMRVEWDLSNFSINDKVIGLEFGKIIGDKFNMTWKLYFSDEHLRMALFVSEFSHCLYDIISRCHSGEWNVDIPVIISNHPKLKPVAEKFGIDFIQFPVSKTNKFEQEKLELELLEKLNIDFIVLARYMQILSNKFVSHYPNRIINIHHSFLPAFPGAKPYHSAYERGVKVIGSTSHYVTVDLDAGPIIDQDVVRVTHADAIADLVRKGRDLEKVVLSRAIWYHIQRKILVYDNRTVIFT